MDIPASEDDGGEDVGDALVDDFHGVEGTAVLFPLAELPDEFVCLVLDPFLDGLFAHPTPGHRPKGTLPHPLPRLCSLPH